MLPLRPVLKFCGYPKYYNFYGLNRYSKHKTVAYPWTALPTHDQQMIGKTTLLQFSKFGDHAFYNFEI